MLLFYLAAVLTLIHHILIIILITLLIIIVVVIAETILRCLHLFLVLVIEVCHVPVILIKEIILIFHSVALYVCRIHGTHMLLVLLPNLLIARSIVAESMTYKTHSATCIVAWPRRRSKLFHISFIAAWVVVL